MTLILSKFRSIVSSTGIFNLQIEHYAIRIAFCVQCFSVVTFRSAYYSVYGVNLFITLNINDSLYLKVADLVMYLTFHNKLHILGR